MQTMHKTTLCILYISLAIAILANMALWRQTHKWQAMWTNVPPAPKPLALTASTLGDKQFAYRTTGILLQNLGDTGGRTTNLRDYDYSRLKDWLYIQDHLDPKSSFVPFLAAYYYGATDRPEQVKHIVDYLETIGTRPQGQSWRWLARAIFLARYTQQDMQRALELAEKLAAMENKTDLPIWARQMPAFILNARGEKEAARAIIEETLKSEAETLHPNEVNVLMDYICTRLLDENEAASHPWCKNLKDR